MTRVSSISIARLTAVSVAIGAFIALGISNCQSVFAQATGGKSNLSNAQLTALVRDPSVGSRALSVTVVGSGPLVTVLAEEREAAQDKDLKIDAMFLSRTLIEGAPGQIDKVKVLFSQTGKPARHITISRGEINDFSAGRISAATLLQSLTLVAVHAENMPEITDGPEVERRLLAWKRIDKLRAQGTGVSPFEAIFKEIQGLAKANDAEKVSQRLTYLESKLTGQEEQVKQAKDSLRGRGVPAVKTASTAGAGAGAGAATPSGHSGAPAQSAASGYIPPEADHLRSTFNAQSSEIISQVTRKNSTEGFKLRDLKAEIEKAFASHQDAKAFEMLHNFDLMATKILGTSAFGPGGQGGQGGGMGGGMNPGGGPPGGGPPGGGPPGGGPPF
jgi:hypothetical protein